MLKMNFTLCFAAQLIKIYQNTSSFLLPYHCLITIIISLQEKWRLLWTKVEMNDLCVLALAKVLYPAFKLRQVLLMNYV